MIQMQFMHIEIGGFYSLSYEHDQHMNLVEKSYASCL